MPGHYVISKHGDGWLISVDGAMVLICERKKAAIRAVQDATSPREASAGGAGSHGHSDAEAESRDDVRRTAFAAG